VCVFRGYANKAALPRRRANGAVGTSCSKAAPRRCQVPTWNSWNRFGKGKGCSKGAAPSPEGAGGKKRRIDSLRARQAGPLFIACGSYVDARPMAKRDRAARKIAADMVDQLDAKGLAECQPERTHERVEEGLGWFTSD